MDEPSPFLTEAAEDSVPVVTPPARPASKPQRAPDRMLPASSDAEMGVICSFLLAPRDVGAMCGEKHVGLEFFHTPSNATVFRLLMEMYDGNKPIDYVTLFQALDDRKLIEEVGGPAAVSELFTFLPTAANASYYIDILKDKWVNREEIRVCTRYASRGYEEQDNVMGLLDELERDVLAIRAKLTQTRISTAREAVAAALHDLSEQYANRGSVSGLATGFAEFDQMTGGLKRAELIVIAARPSNGKTAYAMNIVETLAVSSGIPVGVFSLEMSKEALMQRMISARARVNLALLRSGELQPEDFAAMATAGAEIAASPIYIDDTSAISIQELRGKARSMKQQYGIQALFVDYLQLATSNTKRAKENRAQEVAEISAGLKGIAKELEIPVVALAQINRKFEERAFEKPRLSDLRESGSIEQDADLVAFLVREELYCKAEKDKRLVAGQATLIVAKQRNGPLGDVPLTFHKEFTLFEGRETESRQQELL